MVPARDRMGRLQFRRVIQGLGLEDSFSELDFTLWDVRLTQMRGC
jgi:hypothetical protein